MQKKFIFKWYYYFLWFFCLIFFGITFKKYIFIDNVTRQNQLFVKQVNNDRLLDQTPTTLASSTPHIQPWFKNLYVLGDSLVDQGNLTDVSSEFYQNEYLPNAHQMNSILDLITTDQKSGPLGILEKIVWPEKMILEDPFYLNRNFTDDKVYVEILAEKLNLPMTNGYYFKNYLGLPSYKMGNNLAVGGARFLPGKGWKDILLNNFTIGKQAQSLIELKKMEEYKNLVFSDHDLFYISAGNNDLFDLWLENAPSDLDKILSPLLWIPYYYTSHFNPETIATKMFTEMISAVNNLAQHGGKKFILSNIVDITKTPRITNYPKKWGYSNLIAKMQRIIQIFNTKLIDFKLNSQLEITIFDAYGFFEQLLNNWINRNFRASRLNYGFIDHRYDLDKTWKISIKNLEPNCQYQINDYFFFDDIHPVKWVHQAIAHEIFLLIYNENFQIDLDAIDEIKLFFQKVYNPQLSNLHKVQDVIDWYKFKIKQTFANNIAQNLEFRLKSLLDVQQSLKVGNNMYPIDILFRQQKISATNGEQFTLNIVDVLDMQMLIIDVFNQEYDFYLSYTNLYQDAIEEIKLYIKNRFAVNINQLIDIKLRNFAQQNKLLNEVQKNIEVIVTLTDGQMMTENHLNLCLKIRNIVDLQQIIEKFYEREMDLNLDIRDTFAQAAKISYQKLITQLSINFSEKITIKIPSTDNDKKLQQQKQIILIDVYLSNSNYYSKTFRLHLKIKNIKNGEKAIVTFFQQKHNLNISTIDTYDELKQRVHAKLVAKLSVNRGQNLFLNFIHVEHNQNVTNDLNLTVSINWIDEPTSPPINLTLYLDNVVNVQQIIIELFAKELDLNLTSLNTGDTAALKAKQKLYNLLVVNNYPSARLSRIQVDLKYNWHTYKLEEETTFFTLCIKIDDQELHNPERTEGDFRLKLINIVQIDQKISQFFDIKQFIFFEYPGRIEEILSVVKQALWHHLSSTIKINPQRLQIHLEEPLTQFANQFFIDREIAFRVHVVLENQIYSKNYHHQWNKNSYLILAAQIKKI